MTDQLTRREALRTVGGGLGAAAALSTAAAPAAQAAPARPKPWKICLNTSTIHADGDDAVVTKINAAAKAGYDAVEPWVRDIEKYAKSGGSLDDLRKRIADAGMTVPSAVAFFRWLFSTGDEWTKALEQIKQSMELVKAIGGTGIVAPPAGPEQPLNIPDGGRRYRELIEIGEPMGVMPYVELWGFRKSTNRLGEISAIAIEAHHRNAGIVPDVYHLYKGGSGFDTIRHLSGTFIRTFHFNDVPPDMPPEKMSDKHRIWPGDGVAPLSQILKDLRAINYTGPLSVELFNRDYWKLDPLTAARTGLEKMRKVIAESGT